MSYISLVVFCSEANLKPFIALLLILKYTGIYTYGFKEEAIVLFFDSDRIDC
ncbi:hypothetical protein [Nostoc sp. T09]|uniref:hypothetical protein n=1 Tax=Nostoc sp. T09 TaxID=1932621 RepID=UPI0015C51CF4|nr:hypothetical protein [Nostoc sp. T09]